MNNEQVLTLVNEYREQLRTAEDRDAIRVKQEWYRGKPPPYSHKKQKTHEPHPRVPTALPHLRNTSASFILRHTQTTTNTGPHRHQTKSPQDPPLRRHLQGKSKTCQKHCTNMSHLRGGGRGPRDPWEADHVTPALGSQSQLLPAHRSCNRQRGNKPITKPTHPQPPQPPPTTG